MLNNLHEQNIQVYEAYFRKIDFNVDIYYLISDFHIPSILDLKRFPIWVLNVQIKSEALFKFEKGGNTITCLAEVTEIEEMELCHERALLFFNLIAKTNVIKTFY